MWQDGIVHALDAHEIWAFFSHESRAANYKELKVEKMSTDALVTLLISLGYLYCVLVF